MTVRTDRTDGAPRAAFATSAPDPTGTNLLLGALARLGYGRGTVPRHRLPA